MLIISRKKNATASDPNGLTLVFFGVRIDIKVISTRGNHVRIGIECPRFVRIFRSEILDEVDTSQWNEEDRLAIRPTEAA